MLGLVRNRFRKQCSKAFLVLLWLRLFRVWFNRNRPTSFLATNKIRNDKNSSLHQKMPKLVYFLLLKSNWIRDLLGKVVLWMVLDHLNPDQKEQNGRRNWSQVSLLTGKKETSFWLTSLFTFQNYAALAFGSLLPHLLSGVVRIQVQNLSNFIGQLKSRDLYLLANWKWS